MTTRVTVLVGAGSIGQAIVRRVAVGTTVLLADINEDAAKATATLLNSAGFQTTTAKVDVSSATSVRDLADSAATLGDVVHVVQTAGLSPAQATPEAIIAVPAAAAGLLMILALSTPEMAFRIGRPDQG